MAGMAMPRHLSVPLKRHRMSGIARAARASRDRTAATTKPALPWSKCGLGESRSAPGQRHDAAVGRFFYTGKIGGFLILDGPDGGRHVTTSPKIRTPRPPASHGPALRDRRSAGTMVTMGERWQVGAVWMG